MHLLFHSVQQGYSSTDSASSLFEYGHLLHLGLYFLNGIATLVSFVTPIPLFLFWSSSQAAHAQIIQEDSLNPTPDVREMLSEVIATNQGTHLYSISLPQFSIGTLDLISFNIFSPFLGYFFYLQIHNHQRTLSQVADSFLRHHISVRVFCSMFASSNKGLGP